MFSSTLLDFYRRTNKGFIHPKGVSGTEILLSGVEFNPSDRILDFGCGTGATLVKIVSANAMVNVYGVDLDNGMLNKAAQRVKFCKLKSFVTLRSIKNGHQIPFESDFFDTVIIESVLGIQEGEFLMAVLSEIARVLKPGGKLHLNELLWDVGTAKENTELINSYIKNNFGIIQANSELIGIGSLNSILKTRNIEIYEAIDISGKRTGFADSHLNRYVLLSFLFSLCGIAISIISLNMLRERIWGYTVMRQVPIKAKLKSYIIRAANNKASGRF